MSIDKLKDWWITLIIWGFLGGYVSLWAFSYYPWKLEFLTLFKHC